MEDFLRFISSVSLFSASSSTGLRSPSSTQVNGISHMHGSSQEYKEESRSHSPISTDTSSNDYFEEFVLKKEEKESNKLRTRISKQRRIPYIAPTQEFNVCFDRNDMSELEIKRDIHSQILTQVSSVNNTILSQLVNDIYVVALEMQKRRENYRWWTDSQGRNWRITRCMPKKDS